MGSNTRAVLGSFMDAVCFQYLRINTEETAGRAPIVSAGRKRGYELIESLGLMGSNPEASVIQAKLDAALGANGTRLCLITSITRNANGSYEVRLVECACTMGQTSTEPLCAFTLGVFIGALHAISGTRMTGRETACQAMGAPECIYQIEPI